MPGLQQDYLPTAVNTGPWITGYTLPELQRRLGDSPVVLPICPLGTSYSVIAGDHDFVLPPLFSDALTDDLQEALVDRIRQCFPVWHAEPVAASDSQVKIERHSTDGEHPDSRPRILAFSVDTAVEEHGPHLPLSTDTIQSYSVLHRLEEQIDGFVAGPPVDYGHLTWGLPFGMSVDVTPELLTRYVAGFTNAVLEWAKPDAIYVVDVHGSIVHRKAIVAGLEQSRAECWSFRWLHAPLTEFASERGDQHAGGVETALVEFANPSLIDRSWFPSRINEIEAKEMTLEKAVELTPDLSAFCDFVDSTNANGIVGKIRNYETLDAAAMFDTMLAVARQDVDRLLAGDIRNNNRDAGDSPWERDKV